MADCLIGLGANLGDRTAQLEQACRLLCAHPQIHDGRSSTFHATQPVGGPAGQSMFLNAALRVTTSLSAPQLLHVLQDVERQLGRQRRQRWDPRVIDMDVLLYDQLLEETDELTVPHPRMAVRRFVLAPACEVAADMVHAPTGWTVGRLLARLAETPHYVAIAGIDPQQTRQLATEAARTTGAHLLLDPAPPWRLQAGGGPDAARLELQAIAARLQQLVDLPHGPGTPSADWHVCDYWLPQALARARVGQNDPAWQQVQRECWRAIEQLPLPHCVIFLAAAAMDAQAPHGAQERAAGQTARRSDAALVEALSQQLSRPHQGPVLRIADGDPLVALTETAAAIDAMR